MSTKMAWWAAASIAIALLYSITVARIVESMAARITIGTYEPGAVATESGRALSDLPGIAWMTGNAYGVTMSSGCKPSFFSTMSTDRLRIAASFGTDVR